MRQETSALARRLVRPRYGLLISALTLACLVHSLPLVRPALGAVAARLVQLTLDGMPQTGVIAIPGSSDYYHFSVIELSRAVIYTSGGIDSFGELHSLREGVVARDDDSADGRNFGFERMLLPGEYHLRVLGYNAGSYNLHVDVTPVAPVEMSVDGSPQEGAIDSDGGENYYRLRVEQLSQVAIRTSGGTDVVGALLDSQGELLAQDDDSGEGVNFLFAGPLFSGEYYLRVRGKPAVTGSYNLQSTLTPIPTPELVLDGTPQDGVLEENRPPDYFRFSVARMSRMVVYTSGGLDTGGILYKQSGEVAHRASAGGEGENFRMDHTLFPGEYHLMVLNLDDSSGSYNLQAELMSLSVGSLPLNGSPLVGSISSEGEQDHFYLRLTQLSRATIYTTGTLNRSVTLLDSEGQSLYSISHQGELERERRSMLVDRLLPAGDYYVRVKGLVSADTGRYNLRSEVTPALPVTLSLGESTQWAGELESAQARDYYSFTVTEGTSAMFYTTGDVDTAAVLYGPQGAPIAAEDDGGEHFFNFHFSTTLLRQGEYVLEVLSSSDAGGSYTLHVEETSLGHKRHQE